MKRTAAWVVCATVLSALLSCSPDAALKRQAMGYIEAMADYRIADARRYATEETCRSTLDFFEFSVLPNLDTAYIDSNTPAKIYLDSIVHLSDTQAMVYYHKRTPIQPSVKCELSMLLRDGEWKASQVIGRSPGRTFLNFGVSAQRQARESRGADDADTTGGVPKPRFGDL